VNTKKAYKRSWPALAPDDYKRRRERRKDWTLHSEPSVRACAGKHGFSRQVLNKDHHWILEKPELFSEWRPNSLNIFEARNIPDEQWMPELSKQGDWVVVSGDTRIFKSPLLR
jgi:hypothetical protein